MSADTVKLFKVTGSINDRSTTRLFITAASSEAAIVAFLIAAPRHSDTIITDYLCDRDDIIPTVEPKIEFNEKD
tara:strand:- start:622 stop:843 length:222 start_codon:yes stop_codon:yes gene_type:complete